MAPGRLHPPAPRTAGLTTRTSLAITAGNAVGSLARRLRAGGGTALPGLVALRIDPGLIERLRAQLTTLVFVSGTNGKTTTATFLRQVLRTAGHTLVGNESGSNLERGVAAALVAQHHRLSGATGVFEVDEAVLPSLVRRLEPDVVVLTNLFRDQLDRYGEVDRVSHAWQDVFGPGTNTGTLVVNVDDPILAGIGENTTAQVLGFGLEDTREARTEPEHGADPRRCHRCQGELVYSAAFFGHVGHYACSACGWERPAPGVYAERVEEDGLDGAEVRLVTPRGETIVRLGIGGLYNVCNAVAAAAAAIPLDVPLGDLVTGLERTRPAFGRMQQVTIRDRRVRMLLVKNPIGASAVFRAAFAGKPPGAFLLALNDLEADGTDVSWIWDVDFGPLSQGNTPVILSGIRATDLAVRLKYDGMDPARMTLEPNLATALDKAAAATPRGKELLVMPTYTAMLQLQDVLARSGAAPAYWDAVQREVAP